MAPPPPRTYVAVIGPGDATEETREQAWEVGRSLAKWGAVVVCGRLGGATEKGGTAIGILPNEDQNRANGYLSYCVATGVGQARNLSVVCSGDEVIAVSGGYGALSEVGLALKVGRPVVSLGSWDPGGHVISAVSPGEAVVAAYRSLGG